ncbi:MAG: HD domain-containing protein [Coriobacteriales bacterium]|nr:HD domain-containing protein [Coriobacteriales bacterium]
MTDLTYIATQVLIAVGGLLQVANAIQFVFFLRRHRDAVMAVHAIDRGLELVVGILIAFFIPLYLLIFAMEVRNVWVGVLLFAGAVFVTVVQQWIFHLQDSVREGTLTLAQTLVGVMEANNANLNGHSRHVQNLALLLYDTLPEHERRRLSRSKLSYAALFHDIGKLGISDFIIQKPGKLTEDEMAFVRDHPRIGANILSRVESFDEVSQWVLYHHERVDGQGYYHLPGNEIPFASLIIAVADTFSAVTMRRSYKDPRSFEDGIQVLREAAGTQLDPHLVNVFCKIDQDKVLACAPDTIEIVNRAGKAE